MAIFLTIKEVQKRGSFHNVTYSIYTAIFTTYVFIDELKHIE